MQPTLWCLLLEIMHVYQVWKRKAQMIFFMKRPYVTWIFFSTIHKQMESYPTSFHSMKGLWFFESPYPCIVYHSTTVSLETNPFIH